jgi:hypothetical protein
MKSRFLIFTLFLAVICVGSASNAMAQSVTGTGVFNDLVGGGPPLTVTVSSNGGSGGVMRLGVGQTQVVAQPVDQCVQGNTAFVVAQITHASGDFAGAEGLFSIVGFVDNGKDGDVVLLPFFGTFISPEQIPACDLFTFPFTVPIPVERGGFQVKPS